MSSFFVNGRPEQVSDDRGNTVYILARMGIAVEAKVHADFNAIGDSLTAWRLCLLRHNIVSWEGPDFTDDKGKPIPCTRANIDRLEVGLPLIKSVLAAITDLNRKRTAEASPGEGEADPTPAAVDI